MKSFTFLDRLYPTAGAPQVCHPRPQSTSTYQGLQNTCAWHYSIWLLFILDLWGVIIKAFTSRGRQIWKKLPILCSFHEWSLAHVAVSNHDHVEGVRFTCRHCSPYYKTKWPNIQTAPISISLLHWMYRPHIQMPDPWTVLCGYTQRDILSILTQVDFFLMCSRWHPFVRCLVSVINQA